MSKAAVFFDIDGTLGWNDPSKENELPIDQRGLSPVPSPRVASAIQKLVNNGNHAFLCTGRPVDGIHPDLARLPFEGGIYLAGGYVEAHGKVLLDAPFERELLLKIGKHIEKSPTGAKIEGKRDLVQFCGGLAGNLVETPHSMDEAIEMIDSHTVYKIILPTPVADGIAQDPELSQLVTISALELNNSEVSPRANTKRNGVRSVLALMGDAVDKSYGIGDAENDVSLLDEVDVAIAMGNAVDAAKQHADFVTASVDEDGVVVALNHYGLI